MFLTSNYCFRLKYECESGEKYAQVKHRLQEKQSKTVFGRWISMCENNRGWTFSLEEALLWIMSLHFVQKQQFKVKMP